MSGGCTEKLAAWLLALNRRHSSLAATHRVTPQDRSREVVIAHRSLSARELSSCITVGASCQHTQVVLGLQKGCQEKASLVSKRHVRADTAAWQVCRQWPTPPCLPCHPPAQIPGLMRASKLEPSIYPICLTCCLCIKNALTRGACCTWPVTATNWPSFKACKGHRLSSCGEEVGGNSSVTAGTCVTAPKSAQLPAVPTGISRCIPSVCKRHKQRCPFCGGDRSSRTSTPRWLHEHVRVC